MTRFSQVNKLFPVSLFGDWFFKYSNYSQFMEILRTHSWGKAMFRRDLFVFIQDMLKSQRIEPVNQVWYKRSFSQKQLGFCQKKKLMLDHSPFPSSSVQKGLQRLFTNPKLQILTRLRISVLCIKQHIYAMQLQKWFCSWIIRLAVKFSTLAVLMIFKFCHDLLLKKEKKNMIGQADIWHLYLTLKHNNCKESCKTFWAIGSWQTLFYAHPIWVLLLRKWQRC